MPYVYVEDAAALARALPALEALPLLALDCETRSMAPAVPADLLLVQLGNDVWQVLVDARKVALAPLRPLLEGAKPKLAHNAKFDYRALRRCAGIRCESLLDTFLNELVLENGRAIDSGFSLQAAVARRLRGVLDKSVRASFVNHDGAFTRAQLGYAADDVAATYLLGLEQARLLAASGQRAIAALEGGAVPVFGDMELDGIALDADRWRQLLRGAHEEREHTRKDLDQHFGAVRPRDLFGAVDLAYDSDPDVRAALLELGIYVDDMTRRSLQATKHPAAELLVRYREASKVLNAYGDAFLAHVDPRTGRIHPEFRQIGASTGRVACRNPNLMSVLALPHFRACFRAPPGRRCITADYAACELRIIADASEDPAFLRAFAENRDLHSDVASVIFGTRVSKTENPELRERAKAINFGLAYGMGAGGLAVAIEASEQEAEALLNRYFRAFPRVRSYLEDSARAGVARGFAQTLSGRRLYLAQDADNDGSVQRLARNMPIQGTSADISKLALAKARRAFREQKLDAHLVNMVHDELVVECAESQAEEAAKALERAMVDAGAEVLKQVTLTVEVHIGDHWG